MLCFEFKHDEFDNHNYIELQNRNIESAPLTIAGVESVNLMNLKLENIQYMNKSFAFRNQT